MKTLFVIPARGGSKGIPGKNIKLLNGKPLIHYSIEFARKFVSDEHICLTTDSNEIIACAKDFAYTTPFIRPSHLASDTAGSYEVLQHACSFYQQQQLTYDVMVLLQPTSPFREKKHLEEALSLYNSQLDMVVSVKESSANPYYNLFEKDESGFLKVSKGDGKYTRRQDVPSVYAYNGSIYIINIKSLMTKHSFDQFNAVIPYNMEEKYSIDIDTPEDWVVAEYMSKIINNA